MDGLSYMCGIDQPCTDDTGHNNKEACMKHVDRELLARLQSLRAQIQEEGALPHVESGDDTPDLYEVFTSTPEPMSILDLYEE